jgi:hypothetical protein
MEVLRRLGDGGKRGMRRVSRAARAFVDSRCEAIRVPPDQARGVAAAAAAGRLPSLRRLTLTVNDYSGEVHHGCTRGLAALTELRVDCSASYLGHTATVDDRRLAAVPATAGLASLAAGLPQLRRLAASGMRDLELFTAAAHKAEGRKRRRRARGAMGSASSLPHGGASSLPHSRWSCLEVRSEFEAAWALVCWNTNANLSFRNALWLPLAAEA